MTANPSQKRAMCAACLRPQSACICRWIAPAAAQVELLILQHPLEVANAKNSARLLHLCVPGSVLVAGESFEPEALSALLHGGGRSPVLLYPETPADASPSIAGPELLLPPAHLRLVVLDATWRKSRKMLYQNALLQALPRLALRDMPAPAYRVLRKAHAPDQLSTLEAAAHALLQLEGNHGACGTLLSAFDGFVGQLAARTPRLKSD
jgi:DTW domain-containing protein YfiP